MDILEYRNETFTEHSLVYGLPNAASESAVGTHTYPLGARAFSPSYYLFAALFGSFSQTAQYLYPRSWIRLYDSSTIMYFLFVNATDILKRLQVGKFWRGVLAL